MTEHGYYWQHDQTIIDFPFPLPERFLEQAGYHHGGRFGGRAETRSYEVAVESARKRVRDQQLRDPRDLE